MWKIEEVEAMKRVADWLRGLLALMALTALILALVWLFRMAGQGSLVGQEAGPMSTRETDEPIRTVAAPAEETPVLATTESPTNLATSTVPAVEQNLIRLFYVVQPPKGVVTLWILEYDIQNGAITAEELTTAPYDSAAFYRVYELSVSPDGRYVALNLRGGAENLDYAVWTAQTDGLWLTELQTLDKRFPPIFWDWMPDSTKMLVGERDGEIVGAISITGDGFEEIPLISKADYYHTVIDAAVSPNASQIAFSIGLESGIWFVPLNENRLDLDHTTEFVPPKRARSGAFSEHVTWSPSGSKIAYFELLSGETSEIQVVDVQKGDVGFLSSDDAHNLYPDWSSDGDAIVYIHETSPGIIGWDGGDPAGWNSSIWVAEVETGQYHEIVSSEDKACWSARWLPGRSEITFVSNRTGQSDIWIVNRDGSGLRQLTYQGDIVAFDVLP
jgi:hypothetical protein